MEKTTTAENVKPSLFRIIQSDYLAMLGILLPSVSLILYVSVAYFGFFPGFRGHDPIQGTEGAPLFFYLFLAGLVLGIPLAIGRIRSIQRVFSTSIPVVGQVTDIYFYRDRGKVQFTYTYQDQEYSGVTAIMKTRKTSPLSKGSKVTLLIDRENPARALIRVLYI